MQHGSRNHSSRFVPTCSASLLFVTSFVVFVLTSWLATTNLSQQNLHHLHQHHRRYQEQKLEQQKKKSCYIKTTRRTPPQRKVEKKIEGDNGKTAHQQNHYHHIYLQLLKKICEGYPPKQRYFQDDDHVDKDGKKKKFPSDFNSDDTICNDPSVVATTLFLLLLLEVKRRSTTEFSRKSSLNKKPQGKTCFRGDSYNLGSQVSITNFPTCSSPIRHPPNTITKERDSLMNTAYEFHNPRQVCENEKKSSEVTAAVDDIITNVDQNHKQDHIHESLVDNPDFKEGKLMTLILVMKQAKRNEKRKSENSSVFVSETAKWNSQEWVVGDQPIKMEFCGNFQQRNLPMSLLLLRTRDSKEGQSADELLQVMKADEEAQPLNTTASYIAPGVVAIPPVSGSRNGSNEESTCSLVILTSFSVQFSVSSLSSFPLPSCPMTFPNVDKRFIITDISNSTLSLLNQQHYDYYYNGSKKVETSEVAQIVFVENSIVVPVQVIIITRRKRDFSLGHHHHHHFSILFPSVPCFSNHYFQTTSGETGLLLGSFPFLLLTSSVTVTPRRTTTASTTSFQPLFCSWNKAEEEGCLPHLLVKRLPATTKPLGGVALPQSYYSRTVPTTSTKTSLSCSSDLPTTFDCSLFHTTTTTQVAGSVVER